MISRSGLPEAFIGVMQREFPDADVVDTCWLLWRNVSTYSRLQRLRMERQLTPFEWRQEVRTERRIRDLCHGLPTPVEPVFTRESGRCYVRLRLPSGRSNDAAGVGWGVPGTE